MGSRRCVSMAMVSQSSKKYTFVFQTFPTPPHTFWWCNSPTKPWSNTAEAKALHTRTLPTLPPHFPHLIEVVRQPHEALVQHRGGEGSRQAVHGLRPCAAYCLAVHGQHLSRTGRSHMWDTECKNMDTDVCSALEYIARLPERVWRCRLQFKF